MRGRGYRMNGARLSGISLFFFNDPAPTEIYTLSLHDALPIFQLTLNEEEKKLAGRERIEALQKLADRATDFTQALLEKSADFKQAAAKFQLPVRETGEFTAAEPDPQLKVDPKLGAAAFKLSTQEPHSDAVQVADGFYILNLTGETEARPLTLEEAKPKIVDALKKTRARELMSTKGAELVQQLREAKKY